MVYMVFYFDFIWFDWFSGSDLLFSCLFGSGCYCWLGLLVRVGFAGL